MYEQVTSNEENPFDDCMANTFCGAETHFDFSQMICEKKKNEKCETIDQMKLKCDFDLICDGIPRVKMLFFSAVQSLRRSGTQMKGIQALESSVTLC